MSSISNAHILIRNSFLNLARGAITFSLTLIITPYIIAKTGLSVYGVYAFLLAISLQVSSLDLGQTTTIAKYISQYYATDDFKKINKTVNNGLFIRFTVAGILISLLFIVKEPLLNIFYKTDTSIMSELHSAYLIFIIAVFFNIVTSAILAPLKGIQRMDITNLVNGFLYLLDTLLIFFFLKGGFKLSGLLIAYAVSNALAAALSLWYLKKLFPQINFSINYLKLEEIKRLSGYGLKVQITGLTTSIHSNYDKFLIGPLLGVNFVAFYDLAGKIVNILRNFASVLLEPIMPAASEIATERNSLRLVNLYQRSFKYLFFLLLPIFFGVGLWAKQIIFLWLGAGYELVALTLQIFLVANFVTLIAGPSFFIFVGIGKVKYATQISLLGAITNLVLSPVLILLKGFTGAVLGTSIAMSLTSFIFILFFLRHQKISLYTLRANLYPLFSVTISTLLVVFLRNLTIQTTNNIFFLAPLGLLFYFISIPYNRFLDDYDRRLIKIYSRSLMDKIVLFQRGLENQR